MQYRKFDGEYMIRLEIGEEVVGSLTAFAREMAIKSGVISAIGAVRNATLGYFNPDNGEYIKETFEKSYEIAGLNGSASIFDGKPLLHLHATLADDHHDARAGHLFSAEVSATVEVHIKTFSGVMTRKKDPVTGLNLLDLSDE